MKRTREVIKYEASFEPESFEIIAVTGSSGFGGGRGPKEEFWTARISLAAWKRPGEEEIHEEERSLTVKADDEKLRQLREAAPEDSVIRARVRKSKEHGGLLLAGLPERDSDPQLCAFLEERMKPVYYEDEALGQFTLNRVVNWFEREVDWPGGSVSLSFDLDDEEEMREAVSTARTLLAGAEEWDKRIREYAAAKLTELKNEYWLDDGEEPVAQEEFAARLSPESLGVEPEGGFDFWFGDDDIFWGHAVHVWGSLSAGPEEAQMEG